MTVCKTLASITNTPKTTTYELVVGTKHGIISIRAQKSLMMKGPLRVYTGYDPANWEHDPSHRYPSPPDDENFWGHRYIKEWRKKLYDRKFASSIEPDCEDLPNMWATARSLFPYEVVEAIQDALHEETEPMGHWNMLQGMIAGEPSAKKRSSKSASTAASAFSVAESLRASVEALAAARAQHIATDTGWGIF